MTLRTYGPRPATGASTQVESAAARQPWAALAVLFAAVTGFHLVSLLRTPAPFVDEAWYAARAWALLHTGRAFGTLDAGVFDRFDGHWTFFPWLGTGFDAIAIHLLGVSLFSVRLVSLIFGLLLVVAIYVIGRHLGGPCVGLVAVGLMAFSRPFIPSSHLARQDIMVAALGFGAIALYLTERASSRPLRSLLAGLAVGLAFEIHPNAVVYGSGVATLMLLDYGRSLPRQGRFWAFAIGGLGGLALYATLHILPYPETYAALNRLAFAASHTPPLLSGDAGVWIQSLADLGDRFTKDARTPLVALAFVILARRQPLSDRAVCVLLAVLTLALALLNRVPLPVTVVAAVSAGLLFGAAVALWRRRLVAESRGPAIFIGLVVAFLALLRNKLPYYDILLFPACDLLVAIALTRLPWNGWSRSVWGYGRTVLVLAPLMALILGSMLPMRNDPMDDYRVALERINEVVPLGKSIMGSQTYWFGRPDQRYFSWEQLVYYRRYAADSSLEDAVAALHPDFFIVDTHMEQFIREDTSWMTNYSQSLYVSKPELDDFLARHGHLVFTLQTTTFGRMRVYEIDWGCCPT